jgi:hypothetical protein
MTQPSSRQIPSNDAASRESAVRTNFSQFYREVFLPEHRQPANVALHVLGTVAGIVFLVWVFWAGWLWLALLFPVVHALPGLIGHRLFERNAQVGDVRVLRQDHSPLWFIVGNHRMLWELLTRGFYWRAG